MEFVNKIVEFILFIVNTIKDLVASVSGRAVPAEETTVLGR